MAARKQFLLHHKALGAHVRTLFNQRLRKEHPELWAQVLPAVWKTPWNVGAQAAGSGQDALRYLSRYIFKTATSNRPVQLLPEGKLLWTYRESKSRKFTSLKLELLELMSLSISSRNPYLHAQLAGPALKDRSHPQSLLFGPKGRNLLQSGLKGDTPTN